MGRIGQSKVKVDEYGAETPQRNCVISLLKAGRHTGGCQSSVCAVTLSLFEYGPARFDRQPSFTDFCHTIPHNPAPLRCQLHACTQVEVHEQMAGVDLSVGFEGMRMGCGDGREPRQAVSLLRQRA